MAYQSLDLGSTADDWTGDTLRAGGDKINDNFSETIHPSQIDLKQEINKTGNFSLSVNLHSDIAIELRVIVEKIVTK